MGDADVECSGPVVYRIAEIFYSIQGEGRQAGTPMLFIRFATCNLKCSFCDTDHKEKSRWTLQALLDEVAYQRKQWPFRWVCLTGGEPLLQVDENLVRRLQALDTGLGRLKVAVETNGTILTGAALLADWLTVSPKNLDLKVRFASELKVVYPAMSRLLMTLEKQVESRFYFIQAESRRDRLDEDYLRQAIDFVKHNPKWGLSVQLHKVIGVQ